MLRTWDLPISSQEAFEVWKEGPTKWSVEVGIEGGGQVHKKVSQKISLNPFTSLEKYLIMYL